MRGGVIGLCILMIHIKNEKPVIRALIDSGVTRVSGSSFQG